MGLKTRTAGKRRYPQSIQGTTVSLPLSLYNSQRSEAAHTHFTLPRPVAVYEPLYISVLRSGSHADLRAGGTEIRCLAQRPCHRQLDLPCSILGHSLRQGSTGGEPWGRQCQQEPLQLPNSSEKFMSSLSLHTSVKSYVCVDSQLIRID